MLSRLCQTVYYGQFRRFYWFANLTVARSGLKSIRSRYCEANGIDILSGELLKQRDSLCQDEAKRWITAPLRSYCEENNIAILSLHYSYDAIGIALSLKGIDKTTFRFNTEGAGTSTESVTLM